MVQKIFFSLASIISIIYPSVSKRGFKIKITFYNFAQCQFAIEEWNNIKENEAHGIIIKEFPHMQKKKNAGGGYYTRFTSYDRFLSHWVEKLKTLCLKKYHLSLVTHIYTKLSQNVCPIDTHISIY